MLIQLVPTSTEARTELGPHIGERLLSNCISAFIVQHARSHLKKGLGVGAFEVGENNVAVNSDTHDTLPPSQKCIVIHFD